MLLSECSFLRVKFVFTKIGDDKIVKSSASSNISAANLSLSTFKIILLLLTCSHSVGQHIKKKWMLDRNKRKNCLLMWLNRKCQQQRGDAAWQNNTRTRKWWLSCGLWAFYFLTTSNNNKNTENGSKTNNQPACDDDGQQDVRRDIMKKKWNRQWNGQLFTTETHQRW